MHRSFVTPTAVAMLAALAAGCALSPGASLMPSAPSTEASATVMEAPAGSDSVRPSLPPGFPVMPGASPGRLPEDDPGLIAAWTSDQRGSAAYDFYVVALPAAGYPVEGLYPGGEWALIRFRLADGAIWQLLVHGTVADPVEVQVRLDRP